METILLITGSRAYQDLRSLDFEPLETKYQLLFHQADLDVAAFLSVARLEKILARYEDQNIDWVLVSGLIQGDLSQVNSPLAPKLRKGPKFLHNLIEVLKSIPLSRLSPQVSAEQILTKTLEVDFEQIVRKVKDDLRTTENQSKKYTSFTLSDKFPQIVFSPYAPSVLIAEIVDAPRLSHEKLHQYISHYIRNGADIIDLGCISNTNSSAFLEDVLPSLCTKYDVPFSIDSVNPEEIHTAVNAGAQMVLSIDEGNYHALLDLPKDLPIVLIPTNSTQGPCPIEGTQRIQTLISLGRIMAQEGFTKLLLDPLLEPPITPGFSMSIETYGILHEALQNLPKTAPQPLLFMGVGNITELIDADSPGINSLLAILAKELGVVGLLSTEYSAKTRNSIAELRKAIDLAFIAHHQNATPLNLGINAFFNKSKARNMKSTFFDPNSPHEIPGVHTEAEMDPNGFFKIYVHFKENRIIVEHFLNAKPNVPNCVFSGKTAESLYKYAIQKSLLSLPTHFAYLGKELAKAESCLNSGQTYLQDL